MFQDSIYMRVSLVALILACLFAASQAWTLAAQTWGLPILQIIAPALAQGQQRLEPSEQGGGRYVFTGEGAATRRTVPFEITSNQWTVTSESVPRGNEPFIFIETADGKAITSKTMFPNNGIVDTVTADPGEYVLEIFPSVENASYTVTVEEVNGGTPGPQPGPQPQPQPQPGPQPQPRPNPMRGNLPKSGGPEHGPFPPMPNGECPRGFPVERDGACYPR